MLPPVSGGLVGWLLCGYRSGDGDRQAGSVDPLEVSGGLVERPQVFVDQVQVASVVVTSRARGGRAVGARGGGAGVPVGDGVFERLHPLE
jgi:hypothetical protein